jgi:hypothetical protein
VSESRQSDGTQDSSATKWGEASDPVGWHGRGIATGLGLVAAGAGGVAVFRTENQAGTAMLLLVGAALLVIGTLGTTTRWWFDNGNNSVELAMIRRRAVKVIAEARQEESVEVAAAVVEAVSTVAPIADMDPVDDLAIIYEARVADALDRSAENGGSVRLWSNFRHVDGLMVTANGRLAVEARYKHRGTLNLPEVQAAQKRARCACWEGRLLIVTNAPLSGLTRRSNGESWPVEAVTWNDERDDDLLARAIARGLR